MSPTSDQDRLDQVTRTSQIVVAALAVGVLIFLGIAVVVDLRPNQAMAVGAGANANAPARGQANSTDPILTYTAIATAAICLPLSFVIPNIITAKNRRAIAAGTLPPLLRSGSAAQASGPQVPQTEIGKLTMLYLPQLIVGAALVEGPTFFVAVTYLLEKNPIGLGITLLLVAALIARFPTRSRIERWIAQQQEKLREEELKAQ